MAQETTIYGQLFTPENEDGQRRLVILDSDLDHVRDPASNKTLREILAERNYSNATETTSGLMASGDKVKLESLNRTRPIISEFDPGVPCMWYQVLESEG